MCLQKLLADILSVLALTMSAEGQRVCAFIVGMDKNIFFCVLRLMICLKQFCILWFLLEFEVVFVD